MKSVWAPGVFDKAWWRSWLCNVPWGGSARSIPCKWFKSCISIPLLHYLPTCLKLFCVAVAFLTLQLIFPLQSREQWRCVGCSVWYVVGEPETCSPDLSMVTLPALPGIVTYSDYIQQLALTRTTACHCKISRDLLLTFRRSATQGDDEIIVASARASDKSYTERQNTSSPHISTLWNTLTNLLRRQFHSLTGSQVMQADYSYIMFNSGM